jgi:hypothetical protein
MSSTPRSSTSASERSGSDAVELGQRALIGDTAGAALVGADGTIDWWSRGRLDAEPLLWRLLDPRGPAVGITLGGPPGDQSSDAMIASTVLSAGEQSIEITDFMPWEGSSASDRIVRLVGVRRGPATIALEVATGNAAEVTAWSQGVAFDGLVVRTGIPMDRSGRGQVTLDSGARLVITIDDGRAPALSADGAATLVDRTSTAWNRVVTAGDVAPSCVTSVLVLRALSWLDTGALVGAPTTSLPEVVGEERNRDDRVVRTVDVARWAAVASQLALGEQAAEAIGWLERIVDAGLPVAEVLGIDGDPPAGEHIPGWRGWRRSEPVRFGLDPGSEPSLEAAAALLLAASGPAGAPLVGHWDRLVEVTDWVAGRPPSLLGRRALAEMSELALARHPLDLDAVEWHRARRAAETTMANWGPTLPGVPDPAVLGSAWLGPWPPEDPRVAATVDEVRRQLGVGLYLAPEPPAASVVATLRYARALAVLGRWEEANLTVEAVRDLGGPLGLLPAALDPTSGQARGNRPSAAAHLAFLEASLALATGPA